MKTPRGTLEPVGDDRYPVVSSVGSRKEVEIDKITVSGFEPLSGILKRGCLAV
jgi:hypothetical protein